MPPPVVAGSFIAPERAVLGALAVLLRRCQPVVQRLLTRSSCVIRGVASDGEIDAFATSVHSNLLNNVGGEDGSCPGYLQTTAGGLCSSRETTSEGEGRIGKGGTRLNGGESRSWPATPPLWHHQGQCMQPWVGKSHGAQKRTGVGVTQNTLLCAPVFDRIRGIGGSPPRIWQTPSDSFSQFHWATRSLHSSPHHSAASFESIGEASARKATAIEYKISADEAIHKFQEWSGDHWLGPIGGVEHHAGREAFTNIRAAYQPFWVFDAKVTTLFTGEIGFDYNASTYNSATKRYESSSGTAWRQAPYTHTLQNDHPGEHKDMQVYASYRYRQAYMSRLKGPPLVTQNQPLTFAMLGEGRELDPFTMKREIAWRRVREKIQKKEVRKAEEFLKTTYHAEQARNIQLQMQFESVRARAIYVPAYILEYQHAGQLFLAVVHGATGEVGAERHLSALKVGGLVATGLTAASVASQYLGWGTLLGGAWGAALIASLSVLAGYAAERWVPRLSAYLKELQQSRDVFEDTARAARGSGAEEAGLDDDDSDRERREHWQRQQRYQQRQGFG